MRLRSRDILLTAAVAAPAMLFTFSRMTAQAPRTPAQRPSWTVGSQGPLPEHAKFTPQQAENGGALFIQNCAFCHGKDAGGGETGPDLTRSKLVTGDKNGEAIGAVIRNGRLDKGMPRFSLSDTEILNLVAFIHAQQDASLSQSGNRRGVDESDLHTGNAEAGKKYFEGPGGCTQCHSATGDLAGIASKFSGLRLEMQMLYPRDAKTKATVKTKSGQTFTGTVEYEDEFTLGIRDSSGIYRSWPMTAITAKLDKPVEAHVTAMSKYTDDDIHNVLAYIQTLK
ncbi:c-type cytochrome [Terriglobus albidus]|uniref:c-type cytochrome n=1 Tax=Terriglobus albidus TaxID=1592106 RepID=UPI0021DFBDD3|nr:cytochrome c [Terriglobus albidus]